MLSEGRVAAVLEKVAFRVLAAEAAKRLGKLLVGGSRTRAPLAAGPHNALRGSNSLGLPPIPAGWDRRTHVTTERNIPGIMEHGLRVNHPHLTSTMDTFTDNKRVERLARFRRFGKYDRRKFGGNAPATTIWDTGPSERTMAAPLNELVPRERLLGYVIKGKFTPNPTFDRSAPFLPRPQANFLERSGASPPAIPAPVPGAAVDVW